MKEKDKEGKETGMRMQKMVNCINSRVDVQRIIKNANDAEEECQGKVSNEMRRGREQGGRNKKEEKEIFTFQCRRRVQIGNFILILPLCKFNN